MFAPIKCSFTYLSGPVSVGCRVRIPFGRSNNPRVAIVKSVQLANATQNKVKSVIEVIDETPVFDFNEMRLLEFASQYYFAMQGMVYAAALPKKLKEGNAFTPITEQYYALVDMSKFEEYQHAVARAKKQKLLLEQLYKKPCTKQELSALGLKTPVINALIEKSIVCKEDKKLPGFTKAWQCKEKALHQLNDEQQKAFDLIAALPTKPVLLHGVTASGKTEIYCHLVKEMIKCQKQVLILVPEIGLTPQFVKYFQARFNCPVVSLHSGLNDNKRASCYTMAKFGQAPIVIGTRSAVFTPMQNLGMIIVDEEHDSSFKQENSFAYNGRDMAIMRAKLSEIPVVLGSATPSIESWKMAYHGQYLKATLKQRASKSKLPPVKLLDIKDKPLLSGISKEVLNTMNSHVSNGGQVLVYIGRRGYSPIIQCPDCSWVKKCKACDKPMIFHKHTHKLHCHVCSSANKFPNECPVCFSKELSPLGIGTERVEETLSQALPQYKVSRIDSDSTSRKGVFEQLIQDFEARKTHILIGTQLLVKGHDFSNVSLVVILQADYALYSEDFRAKEHLAQLVHQVAGRSGRQLNATIESEVILQTENVEHPFLQSLIDLPYEDLANGITQERQDRLPPYKPLALIHVSDFHKVKCQTVLENIRASLKRNQRYDVSFAGITSASIPKKQGKFDLQLAIYGSDKRALHCLIAENLANIERIAKNTHLHIDIDPHIVS